MSAEHHYMTRLVWEGDRGEGTSTYQGYGRQWRVRVDGKPDLVGSADPQFREDRDRHNPEDLLVIALSSCHLLSYLALLCPEQRFRAELRRRGLRGHDDDTRRRGPFRLGHSPSACRGGGAGMQALAMELHEKAHATCFIAGSVNFPVHHAAVVTAGDSLFSFRAFHIQRAQEIVS